MINSRHTIRPSTALLATRVTLRILIVLNWVFGVLIFALLARMREDLEGTV